MSHYASICPTILTAHILIARRFKTDNYEHLLMLINIFKNLWLGMQHGSDQGPYGSKFS